MINILEVDSIQLSINGKLHLSDIYMQCSTKEIVSIIGRNGVGKSTLLKIIFGILTPDFSSVRINERVVRNAYLIAETMTYLPPHPFVPTYLKVQEAAEMYLGNGSLGCFFDDPMLFKLRKSNISEISEGERKIVELYLVLNTPAKFVLLDNPFSSLSPVQKDKIQNLISRASRERGIILTDPDAHLVSKISSRVYMLENGSLKEVVLNHVNK